MKLGSATSVLIRYAIQDAVGIVAEAGFDGIDIWGGRPHIYRQDYSRAQLEGLRKSIEEKGLAVSSFMPAFYRYPHSLSSPNPVVRKDSIQYMLDCLENAVLLGAGILLVVPDHSLNGQETRDSFQRMLESVDEVAHKAAQYEIMLGLEVLHEDETDLVNTSRDAMGIIEALGHDSLGVVVDTGALNLSKESMESVLAATNGRLLQVHVNDNDGIEQQNLIPGDGTYDFEAMLALLDKHSFEGFISAELSKDFAGDPAPALRLTVKRMRAWGEKLGVRG
jgi:protein FrlC